MEGTVLYDEDGRREILPDVVIKLVKDTLGVRRSEILKETSNSYALRLD